VACLAVPLTLDLMVTGNPGIWIMAAVAAGTRWGWAFALVLVKPTVAAFALIGMRHRSWWIVFAMLLVVSLPLSLEYITALRNATGGNVSPFYSFTRDTPLLLIPLIAWLGRSRITVGLGQDPFRWRSSTGDRRAVGRHDLCSPRTPDYHGVAFRPVLARLPVWITRMPSQERG
jgi:hypothetical protein